MDELVAIVVQKTGISQDDAQKVVQAILDVLKSRLPGPVAAELGNYLSGGNAGVVSTLESDAGGFLKSELGGVLGNL
ncbi:MAG TPA: hypothetical protein VHY22_18200 [Chthoniobacteraceae bacterium]|jgi:uncharacterized protein (DUF2267 family)|nr:hypothetical protein [Chthoniobacteraceae bacterium]